jgi:hypothetical protein
MQRIRVLLILAYLGALLAIAPPHARPTQASSTSSEPDPHPGGNTCGGTLTEQACCVFGFVVDKLHVIESADMTIESAHGKLELRVSIDPITSKISYATPLSAAPLLVRPGDWIIITAASGNRQRMIVHTAQQGSQQVDLVLPPIN